MLEPGTAPPPHYYAEKLLGLLGGVRRQYEDLLTGEERCLMACIESLPVAPLRLYARLLTRKGALFRVSGLDYREVCDAREALSVLEHAGLVAWCPQEDPAAVLALFPRATLEAVAPRGAGGLRKAEYIEALLAAGEPTRLLGTLAATAPWIGHLERVALERFMALFFGGRHQDFSTFVLEDLGLRRFERYPLTREHRLFPDRASIDRFFDYDRIRDAIELLEGEWAGDTAAELAAGLEVPEAHRVLARRRAQLLNRLGRLAERRGETGLALRCYEASDREPARERRARILLREGRLEAAAAILATIRERPLSAGEQAFAEGFAKRCGLPAAPPGPWPEERLVLPAPPEAGVERAVLEALLGEGGTGRHLESRLPLSLLGLATWDIVFAPLPGAFVNAYQEGPLDLFWPDFRAARASAFAERLDALREPEAMRSRIAATWYEKHGTANALVHWSALDWPFIEALLEAIPAARLVRLFDHALNDLAEARSGFPDLVLIHGPEDYRLIEVKGPGDRLRREQRLWLERLERAGMPASLLRVSW